MANALIAAILLAAGTPPTPTSPESPLPPTVSDPVSPELQTPTAASMSSDAIRSSDPITPQTPLPTNDKLPTKPNRKATATPKLANDQPIVRPPSLTKKAFEIEAARNRNQRTHLEKLASEIATARASLKEEISKLKELAKPPSVLPTSTSPQPAEKPSGASSGTDKEARQKVSIDALAKMLKGMRPESAAAVVSRLDKRLAVALLRRLRPADAAAITEKLKPETAADLFALVALPEPKESP